GYAGAFYTFAAITLVSLPLTWFCMFDNKDSIEDMDDQFYAMLHGEDEITRDSFSKPNDIERDSAYKPTNTPM
ncbi:hypothetical protein BBJ28_00023119, partial [Nothophytophthora sp. Chile5]